MFTTIQKLLAWYLRVDDTGVLYGGSSGFGPNSKIEKKCDGQKLQNRIWTHIWMTYSPTFNNFWIYKDGFECGNFDWTDNANWTSRTAGGSGDREIQSERSNLDFAY